MGEAFKAFVDNDMRNLPGWAALSLTIAGVLIVALTASTITLLGQLRVADKAQLLAFAKHSDETVVKDVSFIKDKVSALDSKVDIMNRENQDRNHTISKLVMLMCIPFKERQVLLKEYKDYYDIPGAVLRKNLERKIKRNLP